MLVRLRRRLTYANVMSTIAVFLALGGSAYAAAKINGRDIVNRSIAAGKIKREALGTSEVRESSLRNVAHAVRASRAETLAGLTADALLVRCPDGTVFAAGVCFEPAARGISTYGNALVDCSGFGNPSASSRRLPTHAELAAAALSAIELTPGGELTSSVAPSLTGTALNVVSVLSREGLMGVVTADTSKPYRCVAEMQNGAATG